MGVPLFREGTILASEGRAKNHRIFVSPSEMEGVPKLGVPFGGPYVMDYFIFRLQWGHLI